MITQNKKKKYEFNSYVTRKELGAKHMKVHF